MKSNLSHYDIIDIRKDMREQVEDESRDLKDARDQPLHWPEMRRRR